MLPCPKFLYSPMPLLWSTKMWCHSFPSTWKLLINNFKQHKDHWWQWLPTVQVPGSNPLTKAWCKDILFGTITITGVGSLSASMHCWGLCPLAACVWMPWPPNHLEVHKWTSSTQTHQRLWHGYVSSKMCSGRSYERRSLCYNKRSWHHHFSTLLGLWIGFKITLEVDGFLALDGSVHAPEFVEVWRGICEWCPCLRLTDFDSFHHAGWLKPYWVWKRNQNFCS